MIPQLASHMGQEHRIVTTVVFTAPTPEILAGSLDILGRLQPVTLRRCSAQGRSIRVV